MTNKEAIEFIDNLIICIKEHPVVADWLVEIADRKTDSDSEKPNNCETCGTPKHLCQYCIEEDRMWTPKTEPQTKRYYAECYDGCNWAVGSPQCEGCEILPKTEWYEKCVKTEPQTCANGCKWLNQYGECTEPSGECHIEYRTDVDEPQTERRGE